MGQFDVMTVANLALEAATDECKEAKTADQLSEALQSFDDAAAMYSDAVRHRMELALMDESGDFNGD